MTFGNVVDRYIAITGVLINMIDLFHFIALVHIYQDVQRQLLILTRIFVGPHLRSSNFKFDNGA